MTTQYPIPPIPRILIWYYRQNVNFIPTDSTLEVFSYQCTIALDVEDVQLVVEVPLLDCVSNYVANIRKETIGVEGVVRVSNNLTHQLLRAPPKNIGILLVCHLDVTDGDSEGYTALLKP